MTDNWRNALLQTLDELIDKLVAEGMSRNDACHAITEEVATLQTTYDNNPHPETDVAVEEPTNDWPAADQPRPVD